MTGRRKTWNPIQPLLFSLLSRHPTINLCAVGQVDGAARIRTTRAAAVVTAMTARPWCVSAGAIQVKRAGEQHDERQRSQHHSQDRSGHSWLSSFPEEMRSLSSVFKSSVVGFRG